MAWELFGGETNEKGFKELDSHISLIYSDAIIRERGALILTSLVRKGFVPQMVFGIGSFSYQYNTRDTFGFAVKATAGNVGGNLIEIFKDPKTDAGEKRSAKGLLAVLRNSDGEFYLKEQASWGEVMNCEFEVAFKDGEREHDTSLSEIRARLHPEALFL